MTREANLKRMSGYILDSENEVNAVFTWSLIPEKVTATSTEPEKYSGELRVTNNTDSDIRKVRYEVEITTNTGGKASVLCETNPSMGDVLAAKTYINQAYKCPYQEGLHVRFKTKYWEGANGRVCGAPVKAMKEISEASIKNKTRGLAILGVVGFGSVLYTSYYMGSNHCAVVTAACGDERHPIVSEFRNFRDSVLNKYQAGRAFSSWYYRNGPKLAAPIAKFASLRFVMRAALIPGAAAIRIARRCTKRNQLG